MSFKRIRSLKTVAASKSPQQHEFQRRTTRLSSRVSKLDSRVTIFEPKIAFPSNSVSSTGEIVCVEAAQDENYAEEGLEESVKRSRKRVKLDSGSDIADIEDVMYVQHRSPTHSSSQKVVKAKRKMKVTLEEEGADPQASTQSPSKGRAIPSPSKSRSPSKPKPIPQSLAIPHPAPPNWQETYDTIKSMRSRFIAPVDTMGCAEAQTGETEPRNQRYASLVSLMLSSQTKDEVTYAAIGNLRTAFGGSISLDAMIEADNQTIATAISKVGFWKKKTVYLKQAAIKLRHDFNSDVPQTVDELCSLPGVGPKMAFLTLQIAWGLNHGIGVDVHIHRITNLLGWHKPPTKTPEQTRLNLQSWLPKELHYDINHLLVGFGQVICLPVNRRCDICDLSSKGLCPSARIVTKSSKSKKEIFLVNQKGVEGGVGPKVEIIAEEES